MNAIIALFLVVVCCFLIILMFILTYYWILCLVACGLGVASFIYWIWLLLLKFISIS